MRGDFCRYSHPVCHAIRRIREEQKINQEEAAERCGLHRTYYSGTERGVRSVSLVNIEKRIYLIHSVALKYEFASHPETSRPLSGISEIKRI